MLIFSHDVLSNSLDEAIKPASTTPQEQNAVQQANLKDSTPSKNFLSLGVGFVRFLGDLESLDNAAITFEGRYGHQFSHPWIPITNIEFTFFNSKTSFLDNWHLLTTPNFQWSLWSPIENHQTGILAGMTFDYTRASYKGDALFQELFYGPMIGWWWQTKWTNFGIIEAHFKYHLQESFHLKTSYFTVSCQYVWEL